jgi:hypothetical protein
LYVKVIFLGEIPSIYSFLGKDFVAGEGFFVFIWQTSAMAQNTDGKCKQREVQENRHCDLSPRNGKDSPQVLK